MKLVNYTAERSLLFDLILTTTIGFVELIGSLIVKLAKQRCARNVGEAFA